MPTHYQELLLHNPNRQNFHEIRFFGAHDRAWIPLKDVYLYRFTASSKTILYLYLYLYRFTASSKTILAFKSCQKRDLRKKLGNCPDQKGEGAVGTKSQLFLEILLTVPLLDIYSAHERSARAPKKHTLLAGHHVLATTGISFANKKARLSRINISLLANFG